MAALSVASGIPLRTLEGWKLHHDAGRVWNGKRWVAEEEKEETDATAALLEYIKSRPVPSGAPSRAVASKGNYAVELIGGDLQYPFHHEAVWEVFLGLAEKMQPDGITLNGDTWDLHYLSRFRQNPLLRADMQADIDEVRELILARVNAAAPKAKKRLTVGNHDLDRFYNYLMEHCPPLMHLRVLQTFDVLMGVSEMGWELVTEGYWLIDKILRVSHGTMVTNTQGGGSAGSAKKEMTRWGCAGITGHTHKLGSFYRRDPISYRVWHEGGCLCDDKKMRAAGVTSHKPYDACEDWHLGCVKVEYSVNGDSYIITDIPILASEHRTFCIYNDEEIVA